MIYSKVFSKNKDNTLHINQPSQEGKISLSSESNWAKKILDTRTQVDTGPSGEIGGKDNGKTKFTLTTKYQEVF